MEVKSKIFKRKTGKSKGTWIIRIEYFDEILGKKRFMERHADKRSDAVDKRDRLANEIVKSHGQIQTGERMTFEKLADLCEKNFYQPAVIVERRKIDGVRSHKTAEWHIRILKKFFGKRLIRQITTESLTDYKLWRLKNGSENKVYKEQKEKRPIKLATVNRELSTMRRIMRFAYGKGWILKDIFFNSKVIEMSAEIERTRLLTFSEEIQETLELISNNVGMRTEFEFDAFMAQMVRSDYASNWMVGDKQVKPVIRRYTGFQIPRLLRHTIGDETVYFTNKSRTMRVYDKQAEVCAKKMSLDLQEQSKGIVRIEYSLLNADRVQSFAQRLGFKNTTAGEMLSQTNIHAAHCELKELLKVNSINLSEERKLKIAFELTQNVKRAINLSGFVEAIDCFGADFYQNDSFKMSKSTLQTKAGNRLIFLMQMARKTNRL